MSIIRISTLFNIDLEFETAEIYKRIFAYIIDFMLLLLFFSSMKYFYYGSPGNTTSVYLEKTMGLDILTISVPMLLYSPLCEIFMNGQTFGKKLMNIRVISLDGHEPSIGQYLVRWMFKAFEWPFFFGYTLFTGTHLFIYIVITGFLGLMGVIVIAATPKNQRFGDVAANTVVVETRSPYSLKDTIFVDIDENAYKVAFPQVLKLSDRDMNTIHTVLAMHSKQRNRELCQRVALKVQNVLQIQTDLSAPDFLKKVLQDYNYLATR